jgi:hypothetical protein
MKWMEIMSKLSKITLLLLTSMFVVGCGQTGHYEKQKRTKVVKNVELHANAAESSKPGKNSGISITVKPIVGKTVAQYPQLMKSIPWSYTYNKCYTSYSYYYKRYVKKCDDYSKSGTLSAHSIFPSPVFEVNISNNTKHVLKFTNSVLALEDGSGNVYDAMDKKSSKAYIKASIEKGILDAGARSDKINGAFNLSDVYSSQEIVSLLDNNFKVLPGKSRKAFMAFNTGKYSNEEFKEFLMNQRSLDVQLYEIPISVDKAGITTETAAYSFKFDVKVKAENVDYYVNVWIKDPVKK